MLVTNFLDSLVLQCIVLAVSGEAFFIIIFIGVSIEMIYVDFVCKLVLQRPQHKLELDRYFTLDKRINSSKVLSEYCFPQVLDRDDDEEWVVTDVIEEATELDSATLEVRTLLCRVLRKRRKQPERPKW